MLPIIGVIILSVVVLAVFLLAKKEGLVFSNPPDIRYWPYYYYSYPYRYENGGAWPPGMESRLNNWQPGFDSGSGWSYTLRPGMYYGSWPRNRWVKYSGSYPSTSRGVNSGGNATGYYHINNGSRADRPRDWYHET